MVLNLLGSIWENSPVEKKWSRAPHDVFDQARHLRIVSDALELYPGHLKASEEPTRQGSNGNKNVHVRFGACTGAGRGSGHPYSCRRSIPASGMMRNEGSVHPSDSMGYGLCSEPSFPIAWAAYWFSRACAWTRGRKTMIVTGSEAQ